MNIFRLKNGNYTNQEFNGSALLLVVLVLTCLAISPMAKAVVPPPDGGYPNFTTAEGHNALFNLTTGAANTAVGWYSLFSDTAGSFNTATGAGSLLFDTADENTAFGAATLLFNTTGGANTAVGTAALLNNTIGTGNTAVGVRALENTTTGNFNIAVGGNAGLNVVAAQNAICIGLNVFGADVSDSCYIGNIFGQTSASGAAVYVNSNHKLGTLTSSCRFKDDIKPMEQVSEALFALKPVTFHYKKEIDPAGMQQFGLVAEEVEKVNPDLVVRDKEGKPYSVRYEQVNAMLLNEFLKEHRKVEEQNHKIQEQETTIAELKKQMETVVACLKHHDSKIQRVSGQIELSKAVGQTALNDR